MPSLRSLARRGAALAPAINRDYQRRVTGKVGAWAIDDSQHAPGNNIGAENLRWPIARLAASGEALANSEAIGRRVCGRGAGAVE